MKKKSFRRGCSYTIIIFLIIAQTSTPRRWAKIIKNHFRKTNFYTRFPYSRVNKTLLKIPFNCDLGTHYDRLPHFFLLRKNRPIRTKHRIVDDDEQTPPQTNRDNSCENRINGHNGLLDLCIRFVFSYTNLHTQTVCLCDALSSTSIINVDIYGISLPLSC